MNQEPLISRREGWFATQIDGDLVMMNETTEFYLSLSGSGGRIWELLAQPRSAGQLCEELAREYAVEPGEVRSEVEAFLTRMRELGAVDFHAGAVA